MGTSTIKKTYVDRTTYFMGIKIWRWIKIIIRGLLMRKESRLQSNRPWNMEGGKRIYSGEEEAHSPSTNFIRSHTHLRSYGSSHEGHNVVRKSPKEVRINLCARWIKDFAYLQLALTQNRSGKGEIGYTIVAGSVNVTGGPGGARSQTEVVELGYELRQRVCCISDSVGRGGSPARFYWFVTWL